MLVTFQSPGSIPGSKDDRKIRVSTGVIDSAEILSGPLDFILGN